jgi:predicted HicB family RNase H-like nuclease
MGGFKSMQSSMVLRRWTMKQYKQLTVKFEAEMLKRIALQAAEEGISKGEWIRKAIKEKLNKEG